MARLDLDNSEARNRIVERIGSLHADAPRRWGRMTPPEAVCHLTDSFEAVMGNRDVSVKSGWFERSIMKWGALYAPVPWPKGVPTRPEVEQGVGGTPPGDFAKDKDALVGSLGRFCESAKAMDGRAHPIFGALTRSQWMRWGYLHTDHHLRQFGA